MLGGFWVVIGGCGPSGLTWTTNFEQGKEVSLSRFGIYAALSPALPSH
jgi:hypothetical protein